MPTSTGQPITIDGSNSGQVFIGDSNTFTVSSGGWTAAVYGQKNQIGSVSNSSGTNTYVLSSTAAAFNQANFITTGNGGSVISITGDWTNITVPTAQTVRAAIAGSNTTIQTNDGTASVVAFGDNTNILGGNGPDTFLLSGQASQVSLGNGPSAVGLQGNGGLVSGGNGGATLAFLAGSAASAPTINAFNPSQGHLSVLLSTGYSAGLTDTGLSPQAFLSASQFEEGAAPTQASTRFLYNPSSGLLSYTPFGSASSASVGVATLPGGLTLNGSNIFISNRYVFDAPVQNALDSLPAAWGVTDPLPTAANAVNFTAKDTTTGVNSSEPGRAYSGPVSYLTQQITYGGAQNVNFTAQTNNVFMKSGSGTDALRALSGQNVLDGGTGSNFLVGGSGNDTFFTDARTSDFVWNTVVNFHPGEMITLYGFVAGQSSYSFAASEGATGYQGVTLNADIAGNGQVTAKVTLAGLSMADLGHLSISSGNNGVSYLAISNT